MDPGMGPTGDAPPASAAPHDDRDLRERVDRDRTDRDRTDRDRADHAGPESSNGDSRPSYREKQVKVVRSSPCRLFASLSFTFLGCAAARRLCFILAPISLV
jgi:hypothetical protein